MAKNKIRVKFAYDDKEVTGWVDFSEMRSCTINGKKRSYFLLACKGTVVPEVSIPVGMSWDYVFTYSVKKRGAFYVAAHDVHRYNSGGSNKCTIVCGTFYKDKFHINEIDYNGILEIDKKQKIV